MSREKPKRSVVSQVGAVVPDPQSGYDAFMDYMFANQSTSTVASTQEQGNMNEDATSTNSPAELVCVMCEHMENIRRCPSLFVPINCTLSFRDLSFTVPISNKKTKTILSNVSEGMRNGNVIAGECTTSGIVLC